jgi:hypothetical protein
MLKSLGAVAAAAALCGVITTSTHSAEYRVVGYGNTSCGTWMTDRKEKSWLASIDSAWVEGFITAMDTNNPKINRATRATDSDGLAAWIDIYCAAHPLDNLSRASEELALALESNH